VQKAARLAALVNIREKALELGADPEHFRVDLDAAMTEMARELETEYLPDLEPSKELQAMLCEPLHRRRLHNLVEAADGDTRLRLASQSTQHANAWTLSAPSVSSLSSAEFRAGLRFALGLPFRAAAYRCPDCGSEADALGVHAVCCQRSGQITRAHTALRDVVAKLFQESGFSVTTEAPVPDRPERPADLLVHCWNGKPLAIDFTIVTPTAPSAARGPAADLLVDRAAQGKMKRNCVPCARAGWVCQPFVCDVFGAVRCDARRLIATLINKKLALAPMERPSEVGKRFWSAVTSAALARAAVQLARLTALDSADLCPDGVLGLHTARGRAAVPGASLPAPPQADSALVQLFVRALEGSTLSLQLPASVGLSALREAIAERTGIPAAEQRLVSAGKTLVGEQSLYDLGVRSGAEVQLLLSLKGGTEAAPYCNREERPGSRAGTPRSPQPSLPATPSRPSPKGQTPLQPAPSPAAPLL
jgi:hypothetical protein